MARVARGRPRPVHPSTSEIFITEQDSVELVKTAMTAAVRYPDTQFWRLPLTLFLVKMIDVVHARYTSSSSLIKQTNWTLIWVCSGVFSRVNWEFRMYDPAAPETACSSFVNGESRLGETGMVWRFAQRNQDPDFDRLMQCIVRLTYFKCCPNCADSELRSLGLMMP